MPILGSFSTGIKKKLLNALGAVINPATSDIQTDGTQKTQITDGSNEASVVTCNGNYGLCTISPSHISTVNSTSTPLDIDGVFPGTWEDISNFGIIVLTVYTDEASSTDGLEVQFSSDGTNIDSSDEFSILANTGKTFSFQTATQYFRVKYTNGGTAQTEFRLQTILKPYYVKPSSHRITDSIVGEDDAELVKAVLSGINPDGIFTNVETTYDNSLKTSLIDGEIGTRAEIEPLGSLKTVTPTRLVGTTFSNGTKDTNFWTETVTGTGSVTQNGEITLVTGTTADSTSRYETVRKARKVTGTTNQFRAVARNVETPAANCIRRIGAYDDNNGFFFQFDGTTFEVASRKNAVDTTVSNGSFNGNAGATIDFGGSTEFIRVVIDYTALSAKFFVDGVLIHTIIPTTASLTETLDLPVRMEIINENGNTTNNSYEILFATILRLGELITNSKYYHISGNAATHILKYGAGKLQKIMFNNTSGTSLTIYDNTAASGDVIGIVTTTSNCIGEWEYNVPYNNGLTIVTVGNSLDATVIYE